MTESMSSLRAFFVAHIYGGEEIVGMFMGRMDKAREGGADDLKEGMAGVIQN